MAVGVRLFICFRVGEYIGMPEACYIYASTVRLTAQTLSQLEKLSEGSSREIAAYLEWERRLLNLSWNL